MLSPDLKEISKNYRQKDSATDRRVTKFDEDRCYTEPVNNIALRNEFSKDRDRILFSRSFRRLEHKAQVYPHEKGDHFRTRLTHTLEVAQIARSITRNLYLNEDLTEAISFGHDIGHSPYGHAGEGVLDDIMSGKDDLDGLFKKINYGGFKHNFNSLRVLDILERKYEKEKGLNLTWQVKEGILKHTKIRRCKDECKDCEGCWDINRFMQDSGEIKKFLKFDFSNTLEGQIVKIADEIAQRQHDLDDGIRDKSLELDHDKLVNKLCEYIDKIIDDSNKSNNDSVKILKELKEKLESRKGENYPKTFEICRRDALVRDIIDYFILDVTYASIENIKKDNKGLKEYNEKNCINKELINFSRVGKEMDKKIKEYVDTRIIDSYNVNMFDGKANYLIKKLFKAYYNNPRQMSKYSLFRLSKRVEENSKKIIPIKFKDGKTVDQIKLDTSPHKEGDKLINLLKLNINPDDLELPTNLNSSELLDELNDENKLDEINENDNVNSMNEEDKFKKCLLEHRYAYMSTISDYIAMMTDNYANNEYSKLYQV